MFFQKVVDGQLVNYPVLEEQVPKGDDTYYPVNMEAPDYDPYQQTLIDHGVVLDENNMPYRKWELVDAPEIEVDPWYDVACKARLELFKSEDQASNPLWSDYRSTLQSILDNAELDEPVGSPDTVEFPVKPE
jgi:hypothetical protein